MTKAPLLPGRPTGQQVPPLWTWQMAQVPPHSTCDAAHLSASLSGKHAGQAQAPSPAKANTSLSPAPSALDLGARLSGLLGAFIMGDL